MAPSILQNAGWLVDVIGAASLVAATALNKWSVCGGQTGRFAATCLRPKWPVGGLLDHILRIYTVAPQRQHPQRLW